VRTRKLTRRRKHVGTEQFRNKTEHRLIYVEVIEGKGLPSLDMMGASDPFCVITCNETKTAQHTQVIENNNNPVWKETLWFEVLPTHYLKLECFDKDPIGQDFIGDALISVKHILEFDGKEDWVPLVDKKKKECGKIHLKYRVSA